MSISANVVPLLRSQVLPEPVDPDAAAILGKLCREDFELWICRSAGGVLSLKWWRWREDAEHFDPLEDGGLTLDAAELQPLAELLASVSALLERKEL